MAGGRAVGGLADTITDRDYAWDPPDLGSVESSLVAIRRAAAYA